MPQWEVLSFDMGIHGWIALGLAVVLGVGLHIGLMWLVRRPHDDSYELGRPAEGTNSGRGSSLDLASAKKDQSP